MMEDEKIVEETTEEEVTPTEEPTQEGASEVEEKAQEEPTEESSEDGATEEAQIEPDPDEQFLIREKVDGQEVVWDVRDPAQRKQLSENARQGVHYTKKMQILSESEKANQGWADIGRSVVNDPVFMEMQMAKQLGYQDPSIVFSNPQQPPEWLKESDPSAYADQLANYREVVRAKEIVKNATASYRETVASQSNAVLFQNARLKYELDDTKADQLQSFVTGKFKPNNLGMYDESDMEKAYWSLFGKEVSAREKLTSSENIRKTIQKATRGAPAKAVSDKHQTMTKKQKDDKDYVEFIREQTS